MSPRTVSSHPSQPWKTYLSWEQMHLDDYWRLRFQQIADQIVADRPGRFEPRVIKKRRKNYHLMTQPREILRKRLRKGDNSFEEK